LAFLNPSFYLLKDTITGNVGNYLLLRSISPLFSGFSPYGAGWNLKIPGSSGGGRKKSQGERIKDMNPEQRTPLTSIIGFSDVMLGGTSGGLKGQNRKFLKHN
jgi:hypothetical protein